MDFFLKNINKLVFLMAFDYIFRAVLIEFLCGRKRRHILNFCDFWKFSFRAPAICLKLNVIIVELFTPGQSVQEELWSVHI